MSENIILERDIFHAGKIFIVQGDTSTDAFIIKSGEVVSFITKNDEQIEVSHHAAGDIIAESNLLFEAKSELSYKAVCDTVVVKVPRQGFEKTLNKLDATSSGVIQNLVNKLQNQEKSKINQILDVNDVDIKATQLVDHLLRGMSADRKCEYEKILLPQFNLMIKALEDLKLQEQQRRKRLKRQGKTTADKIAPIPNKEKSE